MALAFTQDLLRVPRPVHFLVNIEALQLKVARWAQTGQRDEGGQGCNVVLETVLGILSGTSPCRWKSSNGSKVVHEACMRDLFCSIVSAIAPELFVKNPCLETESQLSDEIDSACFQADTGF